MSLLIRMLSFFFPYWARKKCSSLSLLLSQAAYQRLFAKKAISCGKNVQIIRPISIKNPQCFTIGDNFKLDYFGIMEAWTEHNGCHFDPHVIVGNNVSFGKRCHIGCINNISIGNNVLIGSDVLVIDHNHGRFCCEDLKIPPNERKLFSNGGILIENNVWIGDKVTILGNVRIGKNCIIGANSVVTKDIPDNTMACGIPAVVVKRTEEK